MPRMSTPSSTPEPFRRREGKDDTPPDATTIHVRRAVGGDRDELDWIVKRFSPLLRVQAEYRIGPDLRRLHDPDDIVNDVWGVALPKLKDLPVRNGRMTPVVLKFLSTAVKFRVSTLVQKHVKGKPKTELPDSESGGKSTLDQLADDVPGVVSQAMRREQRDAVTKALESLAPADKEIIVLRAIEQRQNTEAAELLGLTPGAAAVRYFRALERLKTALPGTVFDDIPLPKPDAN